MLTKHTAIEITKENPFANDKLGRKKIVENLTRLLQSTNQPFVISIEAPWGYGKTTFINMWKENLESQGHTCLYFNAWENDFVEDPLIAFIGEMGKNLVEKKYKGKIQSKLKNLQNIGGKIVRRTLPVAIQIATQGLLTQDGITKASELILNSSDEVANFASELAKERIQQYERDKDSILEFKKELASFSKTLIENESRKSPLVFFVDELDRCQPDFAIRLLERIKHIFSVDNVVFVLGLDRRQAEQSVKSIYGQGMDVNGYLRKFIDYSYKLPIPTNDVFSQYLFERYNFIEVITNELNGFIRVFTKLSNIFGFSFRVQEQCFTEMNLVFRTSRKNDPDPFVLAFLIALKSYDVNLYNKLESPSSIVFDEILDLFISTKQGIEFIFSNEGIFIQSALVHHIIPSNEREIWATSYKKKLSNLVDLFEKKMQKLDDNISWSSGSIGYLINRISIVEDFVI